MAVVFPVVIQSRLEVDMHQHRMFYEIHTIQFSSDFALRNATASIERMANGELIAVWSSTEPAKPVARRENEGFSDTLGAGRILSSFSEDGGSTWSDPLVVDDMADGCPTLLVDEGRVFVSYDNPETTPAANHLSFDDIRFSGSRWVQRVSENWGRSWSAPRPIATGHGYAASCSNGIKLRDGTLVWPFNWVLNVDRGEAPTENEQICISSLMRSTDRGETWTKGGDIGSDFSMDISEPAMIELSGGELFSLMRTKVGRLYQSTSEDGGETWSNPVASPLVSPSAPAALFRLSFEPNKVVAAWNWSTTERFPLVIALSVYDCATWSTPRVITNPSRGVAYPNMTAAPDGSIFVVWDEAPDAGTPPPFRRHIMTARLTEEWILS